MYYNSSFMCLSIYVGDLSSIGILVKLVIPKVFWEKRMGKMKD